MSAAVDADVPPVEALGELVPVVPVVPVEPVVPVVLVGASGQWCADVIVVVALLAEEPPLLEPLLDGKLLEPDVAVEVLAVVDAWIPTVEVVELAPAASMPMPRLAPAAPATTAAATTACLSFITSPFTVDFPVGRAPTWTVKTPVISARSGRTRNALRTWSCLRAGPAP